MLVPEAMLADLVRHVEADPAVVGHVRADVLADPRQRSTVLIHLMLEFRPDVIGGLGLSDEAVFWNTCYWHWRVKRLHERLEHDGGECHAIEHLPDGYWEDAAAVGLTADLFDELHRQAVRDADAALGPGPLEPPASPCDG